MAFGLERLGPAPGGLVMGSTIANGTEADDAANGGVGRAAGGAAGSAVKGGSVAGGIFFLSMLSRGFALMVMVFGGHGLVSSMISISSSLSASFFIFCCSMVSRIDLRSSFGRPR
jgi:hypothetical protein